MSDPRPVEPSGGREYQLGPELGRGSFGSVYRGRLVTAAGFQKDVAIKVLKRQHTDTQLVQRLRDEARLLGLLRHRAIVGVDDLVEIEGEWAVVMEYVEGVDLTRLANLGPLPLTVACEIGREVALALETAHTAVHPDTDKPLRVVHRDIKTSNIRLTPQGDVKVLDFGIATARFEQREAQTQKAQKFGTPGYMAPERYLGQAEPGSDVYALGAVLFRVISGKKMTPLPPIPSGFESGRKAAFAEMPKRAAALVPLLERMMAFEYEDRPTAHEVAVELRRLAVKFDGPWLEEWATEVVPAVLAGQEPPAGAVSGADGSSVENSSAVQEVPPRPRRRSKNNRLIPVLVVVLLLAGGCLLVVEGIIALVLVWFALG